MRGKRSESLQRHSTSKSEHNGKEPMRLWGRYKKAFCETYLTPKMSAGMRQKKLHLWHLTKLRHLPGIMHEIQRQNTVCSGSINDLGCLQHGSRSSSNATKSTPQIRKAKSDFVLALAPENRLENSGTGLSDNSQKLNLPRLHQLLAVFKKGKAIIHSHFACRCIRQPH